MKNPVSHPPAECDECKAKKPVRIVRESVGPFVPKTDWSNSKTRNIDKETIGEINMKDLRMAEAQGFFDKPNNMRVYQEDYGMSKAEVMASFKEDMVDAPRKQRRYTPADYGIEG